MQCPQYMTLLEELRARLLANASTGAYFGPNRSGIRTETISSYIGRAVPLGRVLRVIHSQPNPARVGLMENQCDAA